jgi:N-acetylmuramoyl-L-alanine amidase
LNGGADVGAIASDGTSTEADLARQFCGQLIRYINPAHSILWPPSASLRPGDTPFRGRQRAEWANDQGNVGLFLSIHLNAVEGHQGEGSEIFTQEKGRPLAEALMAPTAMEVSRNRGIKEGPFSVLTRTDMPAVLVELAFIDNVDDFAWYLFTWKHQAKAIARALNDYIASVEGRPADVRTKVEGKRCSGPKRVPADNPVR